MPINKIIDVQAFYNFFKIQPENIDEKRNGVNWWSNDLDAKVEVSLIRFLNLEEEESFDAYEISALKTFVTKFIRKVRE